MQMSGADIVLESLKKLGIDTVFGYPGGVVLPLYDRFPYHPEVRHILVRHEQAGGHAADGYARASGKLGCALATSGPGAGSVAIATRGATRGRRAPRGRCAATTAAAHCKFLARVGQFAFQLFAFFQQSMKAHGGIISRCLQQACEFLQGTRFTIEMVARCIARLIDPSEGKVLLYGEDVTGDAAPVRTRKGMGRAFQLTNLFPNLTVRENLEMGAFTRSDKEGIREDIQKAYQMFPILGTRQSQPGGLLSGGEQQMLAIARALMARPRLLLLDEPSLGLAPIIVKQIFAAIKELNETEGLTVFLVEQNAFHALRLADRAYVLVNGAVTMTGAGAELLTKPEIRAAYLEGGH